ncbi:MAG: hypothetical protein K5649_01040 [Lachnospiraceae bacterium]|nr:hypothetical protein [Lachnospiraceae bacterium]
MITIDGYKTDALTMLENKVLSMLKAAISSGKDDELYFLSDLYAAIGIAISRNNASREGETE